MSATITDTVFRSTSTPARNKQDETTAAARSITEAETAAREAKTIRLRKLRIAKEQDMQANEATAPSPRRKARKSVRTL